MLWKWLRLKLGPIYIVYRSECLNSVKTAWESGQLLCCTKQSHLSSKVNFSPIRFLENHRFPLHLTSLYFRFTTLCRQMQYQYSHSAVTAGNSSADRKRANSNSPASLFKTTSSCLGEEIYVHFIKEVSINCLWEETNVACRKIEMLPPLLGVSFCKAGYFKLIPFMRRIDDFRRREFGFSMQFLLAINNFECIIARDLLSIGGYRTLLQDLCVVYLWKSFPFHLYTSRTDLQSLWNN